MSGITTKRGASTAKVRSGSDFSAGNKDTTMQNSTDCMGDDTDWDNLGPADSVRVVPKEKADAIDQAAGVPRLLRQKVSRLERQRYELAAALRPLAALAKFVDEFGQSDDSTCMWRLKASDIRNASALLARLVEGGEG